ncbi:acetyl-CoA synthetase-like protein [Hortaea werneckii]|nr:acetyl-CoA synthetase-like protein [Hortaea werneckii]
MPLPSLQFRLRRRPLLFYLGVHLINNIAILLRRLRTLKLEPVESSCQRLIPKTMRLQHQPDVPHMLIAVELGLLAHLHQLLQDRRAHLLLLRGRLERLEIGVLNLDADGFLEEGGEHVGLDAEDGDQVRLRAVAVHVCLAQVRRVREVHVLDPLGRDVLALRKLQDVLSTVNDAEAAQFVNGHDIASLEPAIFIGPLTNSSPLGYALIRNSDGATVASRKVAYCLGERDGVCFSKTVPLREVIGKHHAQELMESWVQRRRARDHGRSPVQAKRTRHLPGPNAVIKHMSASTLAALIAPPKRLNNRGTLLKMVGRSNFISSTSSRTFPWKYPIAEPPQRADCSVMRSKM